MLIEYFGVERRLRDVVAIKKGSLVGEDESFLKIPTNHVTSQLDQESRPLTQRKINRKFIEKN